MKLYRSVSEREASVSMHEYKTTARAPGNVPYLVDNLWEWKRPERFPNRRHAVYASPTPELAQQFGGAGSGSVFRVMPEGNFKIAQLEQQDSRYHPECRSLPRLLLQSLTQEWVDSGVENKVDCGRLWMPCLRKEEVESLFNEVAALKAVKELVWNGIRYWDEARSSDGSIELQGEGELFFEAVEGYRLEALPGADAA